MGICRQFDGSGARSAHLPAPAERRSGHLLFTGSMGAFYGAAGNSAYCASKAALLSLAGSLAREMQRDEFPIGVTVLCPGAVQTTLASSDSRRPDRFGPLGTVAEKAQFALAQARMNSVQPDEVAHLALDAIGANRFYVPIHRDLCAVAQKRLDDYREGRQPR